MPIDGEGHAVWTEGMSAICVTSGGLRTSQTSLRRTGMKCSVSEYKREAKRRKVEEQNRCMISCVPLQTQNRDCIAELTKNTADPSTDPDSAKTLLAEIAVLCSYIKRRKHPRLSRRDIKIAKRNSTVPSNESSQTLKLAASAARLMWTSLFHASGKTATAVFDFMNLLLKPTF